MNRRYHITTYQDRATIVDTRSGRTVTATKRGGGISLSSKLPAQVRKAAIHELNRSPY